MVFLCTCRWASLHVHNGWSDFAVPQLLQEGAHPLGLPANELQAIESLAIAVCFQHHLS